MFAVYDILRSNHASDSSETSLVPLIATRVINWGEKHKSILQSSLGTTVPGVSLLNFYAVLVD